MNIVVLDGYTLIPGDLSNKISLHLPLTKQSKNMIMKTQLFEMKKSAHLINSGRKPLVNEEDLVEVLNNYQLTGAGLDVLSSDPPSNGNPILKSKNCIITSHIAWTTQASRKRLMLVAVNNIKAFINGLPQNVVN